MAEEPRNQTMRIATIGGVVGPVIFSIVTVIAAFGRPNYDHTRNFISELGATGAENAAFMNYTGFLLGGILVASLGIALLSILPKDRLTLVASVFVTVFGLGVAISGIISCDLGCPQGTGTTANIIHNTIAPVSFLCLIIATICFGVRWRRDEDLRKLSAFSFATGVIALGLLGALASSLETRELTGLWQRLLLSTLFIWCIIVGFRVGHYSWNNLPPNL